MTSGGRARGLGVARGMLCLCLAQFGAGLGAGADVEGVLRALF